MAFARRLLLRLYNFLRPGRAESELSREVAAHLALLVDEFQRRGLSGAQARRAAGLALGGIEQTKELHREARSFVWLDDARWDLRHALRLLRRDPVFTLTATLSLAIGIGANTTIFTVANALLLQPPVGVAEPHRLVDIGSTRAGAGFGPSSYPSYLEVRERATTLERVYAYSRFPKPISVGRDAGAESVLGSLVTVNYFEALGAVPALGRLFGAADSEQPGASPVVVLSHRFWTRRFGQDLTIVGRTLTLNGHPFTVVGVAAEGFRGTGVRALDAWLPVTMAATLSPQKKSLLNDRSAQGLLIGGRLKPGVSVSQAAADLETIGKTLERALPEQDRAIGLRLLASSPVPGNSGPVVAFLSLLIVIVSLILVVACANVAGLLLARGATRRQEIALRIAIGAGRSRLLRQLLTETLLLFALGGMAGLALARGMTSVLVSVLPTLPFPVDLTLTLDRRVIAFTMGLALAAALLSGLVPALQAVKTEVLPGLRNQVGFVSRLRLRHALVIVQVTLSLVLIVGAGLFTRALHRAASIDPGFDARGVELASLDLTQAGYTETTGLSFARELLERVRALPRVASATLAATPPGGFEVWRETLTTPGASGAGGEGAFIVDWNVVERGYFATLRTPLQGRDFGSQDREGGQPVVIVSEAAGRWFWPGQEAVGKYLLQPIRDPQKPTAPMRSLLVIGVARDVQASSVLDGVSRASVYVPLQQHYVPRMTLVARASDGQRLTDELRALLASLDANLPIVRAETLAASVALGLTPQRVVAAVSGSLGSIALLLAGIGIYGVTAYSVASRTREIGIRIALGARRADVLRMVLREGLFLTLVGSAAGLALAAVVSRVLAGFLFGIAPMDPATFAGTTVLFLAIGLAACYAPARRATGVDPLVALRYD